MDYKKRTIVIALERVNIPEINEFLILLIMLRQHQKFALVILTIIGFTIMTASESRADSMSELVRNYRHSADTHGLWNRVPDKIDPDSDYWKVFTGTLFDAEQLIQWLIVGGLNFQPNKKMYCLRQKPYFVYCERRIKIMDPRYIVREDGEGSRMTLRIFLGHPTAKEQIELGLVRDYGATSAKGRLISKQDLRIKGYDSQILMFEKYANNGIRVGKLRMELPHLAALEITAHAAYTPEVMLALVKTIQIDRLLERLKQGLL